jgi:hypothetical protein
VTCARKTEAQRIHPSEQGNAAHQQASGRQQNHSALFNKWTPEEVDKLTVVK